MKKFLEIIQSLLFMFVHICKDLSKSLDNVNTALRDGKVLDKFQMAIKDSGEISDVTDISVDESIMDTPSTHMNIVIVTASAPSRTALVMMRRTLDTLNGRYGAHIAAKINVEASSSGGEGMFEVGAIRKCEEKW